MSTFSEDISNWTPNLNYSEKYYKRRLKNLKERCYRLVCTNFRFGHDNFYITVTEFVNDGYTRVSDVNSIFNYLTKKVEGFGECQLQKKDGYKLPTINVTLSDKLVYPKCDIFLFIKIMSKYFLNRNG